jgi:hypothetical protein
MTPYMFVIMVKSLYHNHNGHLSYTEVYLTYEYKIFHEVNVLPTSADWLPLQEEFFNFDIRGRSLCITNLVRYPEGHKPWRHTYKTVNIMTRSPQSLA